MKFDAIIIGFGKAGKTLAGFLAKKGEKVALIEPGVGSMESIVGETTVGH